MEPDSIISNPIGWAQMKLLGGGRRILALAGLYAGGMLFINLLFYRGLPTEMTLSAFAGGSLLVTIFIEAGLLFFVGAGSIKKALHRDFTTEMISSHRTTAMSGYTAVLGYLTGPTINVFTLTFVNWIACTILAQLAGQPLSGPTVLFVVFGCLASMVWTFAVLVGLCTRGATSVVGFLIVLMIVANAQELFLAFPGLAVLLSYTTLVNMSGTAAAGISDKSIFVSMIAQPSLALIFFLAAARKFRRDDVAAFNPILAYHLLAICTLICAVALRFWSSPTVSVFSSFADPRLQSIVTLAALALVAMLPVANAARNSAVWARRKAKDPDFREPQPRPFYEAPFIATLLTFTILVLVVSRKVLDMVESNPSRGEESVAWIVLAFLLCLLSTAGLLRYTYAVTQKALWFLLLFVLLTWAGPPLADLAMETIKDRPWSETKSWVFGCSPVGTWILALEDIEGPIIPGLIVQAGLGIGTLFLARRTKSSALASKRTPGNRSDP